jgi:PAS domain S-box-containing protein/putative nucleotidyltransferase with HDIG domain
MSPTSQKSKENRGKSSNKAVGATAQAPGPELSKLEQALELKNRHLQQLLTAARSITSSLDVHDVLTNISTGAMQVTGAVNCDIYLLSNDGRTLIPEISVETDYTTEILATHLDLDSSLTGRAIREERALLFNNAVGESSGFHIPGTPQDVDERLIAAPLIFEGEVMGAMCITRMGEYFSEEDRRLAEAYAAFASSVLHSAQTHRDLQKEIAEREAAEKELKRKAEMIIRNQNVLLELNKLDISDLDQVIHSVTEAGGFTLDADRTGLWLFNPAISEMKCRDLFLKEKNKHELAPSFLKEQHPKYMGSLQESRVIAAVDSCGDERTWEFTKKYFLPLGIKSNLDVAINIRGELVGTFCIETTREPRKWTLEEQDFAISLADIITLALEASERRKSEEALRESEKKYSELTNFLPSIIFELDPSGRITFVNKYALINTGYTEADIRKGITALDVVIPEDRLRIVNNLHRLMNMENFPAEEFTIIRKDASTYPAIIHSTPIMQGNQPIGLRGLIIDITEQKKSEEALRLKSRNQEHLLESVQALTASQNVSEVLEQITSGADQVLNSALCNVYLLEPDGESLTPVVSSNPEYSKFFMATPLKVNKSLAGRAIEMRCCILYNDLTGDTHKTTIPGTPDFGRQKLIAAPLIFENEVLGVMSFIRDNEEYTDEELTLAETYAGFAAALLHNAQTHLALEREVEVRALAEEVIRDSEVSYRGIFDSIAEAIYIQSKDGTFLDVNKGAEKMYGYTRDELIGQTPLFVAAPGMNDLEAVNLFVKRAFRGKPQQFEFWGKRSSGEIFPKEVRLYKGLFFGQSVVIAVATDITERKQADEALRGSEKKYRELVNSMPLSEFELDRKGNITFANNFLLQSFGFTQKDIKEGLSALDLIESALVDKARNHFSHVLRGHGIGSPEYILQRKNGTTFPAIVNASAILENGKAVGLRGFLLDISELKQTEEALQASEVRYRYYIEHVNDGVFCFKPQEPIDLGLPSDEKVEIGLNAICMECNDTFAQLSVLARNQLIGRSVRNFATDLESYRAILTRFFKHGCRVSEFEIHDLDPTGVPHWYQISMFGEVVDKKLAIIWGNMIDVTERRKAQTALMQANKELAEAYNATLEGWSRALEMRERETAGHSLRVVDLTLHLAKTLGVDEEELQHIRRGALLHDIGKMGIPDSILLKPSSLSEDEWVVMRQHPMYAKELLKPIYYLEQAMEIPFCHHERWNGTGYPRKLKGDEIPLAARIFAVVDVYDALTSDRPYRPAWTLDAALIYIREQSGKLFDPQVVDAFFKAVVDFRGD